MARMPGALDQMEQSPRTPMTRYDVVCIHTIVGYAPAHAAHFSTKGDGTIIQSRDTKYRSAANLDGNHRVIAIENEDHGPRFGGTPKLPKWVPLTPEQVESCAKILAWAHVTHGIPLQLCPDSKPGSRGLAYHRQGIDGNFGPGTAYPHKGRVSGGEVWTSTPGKVCPTDVRIDQLPDILARAKEMVNPVANHRVGVLNAPTTTNKTTKRNLLAPVKRVWTMLRIFAELGLSACGLVEVGTVTHRVLQGSKRWIYLSSVNTVTPRNRKGSGLVLDRKRHKVVHRKGLKVPYKKGWLGRLVQPRVLTTDRKTKKQTLWIVAHAPRKRTEPDDNRRVLKATADACKAGIKAKLNVVAMMDSNNLPLADELMEAVGMERVAVQDVMAIYASKSVKRHNFGTQRAGVAGVITDHGGLAWSDLEFTGGDTKLTQVPV